jgi:predicted small lipoprotein YifL
MKNIKNLFLLLALSLGAFTLVGCDNDGPMENAGEAVDEAVEDMKDTAEEAGNDIEDAVDDVQDKMN